MERSFIDKLKGIILENLRDENFNVDKLAKAAGMSHTTLYRKLKSARNQDVSQFIKEVRLNKAMEILQQEEATVADIAFRVGFGSSTYFIKCFHEYYGFPPGEVRKMSPGKKHSRRHGKNVLQKKIKFRNGLFKVNKGNKSGKIIIVMAAISAILVLFITLFMIIRDKPEKSIIVLPFNNLSDDPGSRYFADGIMEDILNNLFRISEMRVVSRTSSEYFRGKQMTSPDIARKMNVNYVVEGSVQRKDQDIRIFIQLIDARNDQHILSEKYEGEMTGLFAFQSTIAKNIADKLNAAISRDEIGHIDKMPTSSTDAYDYYLKARFLLHQANDIQRFDISREGLMSSLQYYEKAIAADSSFAKAWAGLANAWYNLAAWGWYKPYPEGVIKALNFSNRAIEIDPECAEAHAIKGIYHAYPERKFEEAKKELEIALDLNPNFATTHQWYAQLMMISGPIDKARKHINIALELEPYFWVLHNLNSWIYYFEEEYDKGLKACIYSRDLNPDSSDNNWLFILHYTKLERGMDAVKVIQDIFRQHPETKHFNEEIMKAYIESGTNGVFNWLISLNINNPIPLQGLNGSPYYIAWWYAITGNMEESILWLEKCLESGNIPWHYFNLIAQNPDFDLLRDDPRFLAVIEKAGLAPYHSRISRKN